MSARGRAAARADLYAQSWRLLLRTPPSRSECSRLLVAALWAPLALVRRRARGRAARDGADALRGRARAQRTTSARCWPEGLRLHWRRGLALGAVAVAVLAVGASRWTYAGAGRPFARGARPLVLLAFFALCQLCSGRSPWPRKARRCGPSARAAPTSCSRAPLPATLLAVALLLVNAVGAAAALMPLLTLTLAFSFLAAAHFALPPNRSGRQAMASVDFDHVTKRFDGTVAVDDLSSRSRDGEFLVLVGPSGCGKTTALRMLAGLEDVTSGRILIGDRVVNNVAPRRARRGHGLPVLRALPAHDRVRQPRVRPAELQGAEGRDRRAGTADGRDARDGRPAQAQAEAALRRPAPARRARTGDRPRAGGVPDGRAALEPRRAAARADAGRDPQAPAPARDDDDLRHARPGRGDDDGRPDRGHALRRAAADRVRRRSSTRSRQTCSSPGSSARRR